MYLMRSLGATDTHRTGPPSLLFPGSPPAPHPARSGRSCRTERHKKDSGWPPKSLLFGTRWLSWLGPVCASEHAHGATFRGRPPAGIPTPAAPGWRRRRPRHFFQLGRPFVGANCLPAPVGRRVPGVGIETKKTPALKCPRTGERTWVRGPGPTRTRKRVLAQNGVWHPPATVSPPRRRTAQWGAGGPAGRTSGGETSGHSRFEQRTRISAWGLASRREPLEAKRLLPQDSCPCWLVSQVPALAQAPRAAQLGALSRPLAAAVVPEAPRRGSSAASSPQARPRRAPVGRSWLAGSSSRADPSACPTRRSRLRTAPESGSQRGAVGAFDRLFPAGWRRARWC